MRRVVMGKRQEQLGFVWLVGWLLCVLRWNNWLVDGYFFLSCGWQEVKVFAGHEAGVLHAIGNPYGNLLLSGGRDSTIKFWDVMSGVCVKTLRQAPLRSPALTTPSLQGFRVPFGLICDAPSLSFHAIESHSENVLREEKRKHVYFPSLPFFFPTFVTFSYLSFFPILSI